MLCESDLTNDRSSLRSSDGGANESGSGFADGTFTSPEHYEDRIKLMDKINRIKTKIAKAQIACEKDVTEFLHMNKGPSSNLDNPQAVRMKQHFDSKNNKNNKNLESLRKRLAAYEVNLGELDSGTKGTKPFLTAMGANILKTGANVKEMTESVIAAPKSLAKALTGANRKQYGSTGNIALENDGSSVGKSTFYKTAVPSTNMDRIRSLPNHGKFPQEGGTEYPRYGSSDEVISHSDSENAHTSDSNIAINNEHSTKAQRYSKGEVSHISTAINALRNEMDDMKMAYISEMSTLQSENQILSRVMQEEKFKFSKIEESLFELIELHQNENRKLKDDLNNISRRMDYQYNDRFSKLEESVEGCNNKIIRVEQTMKQTSHTSPSISEQASSIGIAGLNLVAEVLKIVLYAFSVAVECARGLFRPVNPIITLTLIICLVLAIFNPFGLLDFAFRNSHNVATQGSN